MGDVTKNNWPHTPEGAIDWEAVFEHPENGIIPALSKAHTKETLHKGTIAVVKQLFSRKNDKARIKKILKELDQILQKSSGLKDFPEMQASINALLRQIKDIHVEKATAYVAAQKNEDTDGVFGKWIKKWKKKERKERRNGEFRRRTVRLIGFAAMAVLMVIGAVPLTYTLYFAEDTPSVPEIIEASDIPLSDDGYPLGVISPETILLLGPKIMILEGFTWFGQVDDGLSKETFLVPVLIIKDENLSTRICGYASNSIESIELALKQTISTGSRATPDDLRAAGLTAMEMINKRRGKVWIKDLYLLYKLDTRLRIMAEKCQLVK